MRSRTESAQLGLFHGALLRKRSKEINVQGFQHQEAAFPELMCYEELAGP